MALLPFLGAVAFPASAVAARVAFHNGAMVFRATPGEANRVRMAFDARTRLVVSDRGAPLSAQGRCTARGAHRARCPLPALYVRVELGDRDDRFTLRSGFPVSLRAGDGADRIVAGGSDDLIWGGQGDDRVDGGRGDDFIFGGGSVMVRSDGDDLLRGGEGEDTLSGRRGADTLMGGTGSDYVFGGRGEDVLRGGASDDFLYGGPDDDFAAGRDGDDKISGGAGDDFIYGGGGADEIHGRAGNDELHGGLGTDRLAGERQNDVADGGAEEDLADGGPGADVVRGGAGDDDLFAGTDPRGRAAASPAGADRVAGGAGNDLLWAARVRDGPPFRRSILSCRDGYDAARTSTSRLTRLSHCENAQLWDGGLLVEPARPFLHQDDAVFVVYCTRLGGCRGRLSLRSVADTTGAHATSAAFDLPSSRFEQSVTLTDNYDRDNFANAEVEVVAVPAERGRDAWTDGYVLASPKPG